MIPPTTTITFDISTEVLDSLMLICTKAGVSPANALNWILEELFRRNEVPRV